MMTFLAVLNSVGTPGKKNEYFNMMTRPCFEISRYCELQKGSERTKYETAIKPKAGYYLVLGDHYPFPSRQTYHPVHGRNGINFI